jgi:hypothetical protein
MKTKQLILLLALLGIISLFTIWLSVHRQIIIEQSNEEDIQHHDHLHQPDSLISQETRNKNRKHNTITHQQQSAIAVPLQNNPSETKNLLFGTSCSFALLLKEITMFSEKMKSSSSVELSTLWLYDLCQDKKMFESESTMAIIQSLLQQQQQQKLHLFSNSAASQQKSFRFASDETFYHNSDEHHHQHFDHDTHSVLKQLRAATIFKNNVNIKENDLLLLISKKQKIGSINSEIAKTKIILQSCCPDDNKKDVEFVQTYIEKRFGKLATVVTPLISNDDFYASLVEADIFIFLSATTGCDSNCHSMKFNILMHMLPGTSFIDVIDHTNNKQQLLDTETLCSLLRIEYVEYDISRSQGYLNTASEAKLHPFENVAGKNANHHHTINSKVDDFIVRFVQREDYAYKLSHNHIFSVQSETRWFEVIKETMASSYFRKYRLKGNVREFDLRRN